MLAPTHAVIALAATVALTRATGMQPEARYLLLVLLGSIAPDIDGDGAVTKPGRIFARFLPRSVARLLDGIGQTIGGLVRVLAGHRGLFHAPLLALALVGAGMQWDTPWLFWFGWGYLWHILADMLTAGGIPLLMPFSTRRYAATPMRTGGVCEMGLFAIVCLYLVTKGYPLLPEGTRNGFEQLLKMVTRRPPS